MQQPLLLPLTALEAGLLTEALTVYAEAIEPLCPADARRAAFIVERLRALRPLVSADGDQLLRCLGLGGYAGRPQG